MYIHTAERKTSEIAVIETFHYRQSRARARDFPRGNKINAKDNGRYITSAVFIEPINQIAAKRNCRRMRACGGNIRVVLH